MCAGRFLILLVAAALGLGGPAAHAQTAPVNYWTPGWPLGFGGHMAGESAASYGNLPGFDGSAARSSAAARYNFSNGWFVGSEASGLGLSQAGGLGTTSSLRYEGMQFGYNFQHGNGLPVSVYAGFDTLKYNAGSGGPFAAFDRTSGTLPGYRAHAGVEIQPAPNVSLSLGFGYTQQPQGTLAGTLAGPLGGTLGDGNLLALPGASSFAFSGRR
jgi:hypothetical protein